MSNDVVIVTNTPPASSFTRNLSTVTTLSSLDVTSIVDGTQAYVNSTQQSYYLDRQTSYIGDNNKVVTATPSGQWINNYFIQSNTLSWLQGGTVSTPTALTALSFQPTDTTKSAFGIGIYDGVFLGQDDSVLAIGYNQARLILGGATTEPSAAWVIEQFYKAGPTDLRIEQYMEIAGSTSGVFRPIIASVQRSTAVGVVDLGIPPGASSYLDIQDNAGNQIVKFIPVAAAGPTGEIQFLGQLLLESPTVFFDSTVVSPLIYQIATSGTTGQNLIIQAQQSVAGSGGIGGNLQLGGGNGSTLRDGLVQIRTGLDAGELEFTPSNGANGLTVSQSDNNILNLLAGVSGSFTITFQRSIANTSMVFVRNNTSQTATISYLSGGTVNLLTATSALIASNGTNLVKIMSGT